MRGRIAAAVIALGLAAPAQAAWQQASSRHFVIYGNDDPRRLSEFAGRLEKFDAAVRKLRDMNDPPVGDGNRVAVFIVPNQNAVVRLVSQAPNRSWVAGFYKGRAEGSIAVVPRVLETGRDSMTSNVVLFHEYAHHLMLADTESALPPWLIEGFAEFMSTATIEKDGGVQFGWAPQFRANALGVGILRLPVMLGGDYRKLGGLEMNQLYGSSWLLTHYLTFEPTRRGQLVKYTQLYAKGVEPMAVAAQAFGDLNVLRKGLEAYLAKPKLNGYKIAAVAIGEPRIEVAALSPGAAAVMEDRIQSRVGVDAKTAGPIAIRMAAAAARFPGDLFVQRALAEAEVDAHHFDAAGAAADRALKIDSRDVESLLLKGRAVMAGSAPDRMAAARKWFMAANAIDPEGPEPLMMFYRTYVQGGARPTANAIAALHYASDLAPQDVGLRMNSAIQYLRDGKLKEGRARLASVAYNPHGGEAAKMAREVMTRLDALDAAGAMALLDAKAEDGKK